MSEYATHGATLQCSCGAFPTRLQVTSNTVVSIQGNAVATAADKKPNVNIMPFGKCLSTNKPCSPVLTAWTGFVPSVQMPGGNPLLDTSMIMCSNGGCIKFQDSGQKKPHKVRTNPSGKQITALKNAAINATPFCEECVREKAVVGKKKGKDKKKQESPEEEKPAILRIYWMDEREEPRELQELQVGQEATVCVETVNMTEGDKVKVNLRDSGGRKFKGGKDVLALSGIVEADGIAYMDNVVLEYE